MRIVILDSFAADQGDGTFWDDLRGLGELVVHARSADGDVVARAAGAVAALTNKVAFSAATFAALPDLRYVGVLATGTNVVDLAAARAAGVAVTNVPSYAAASVAQHVLALVLHFSQDVAGHSAAVKAGAWASVARLLLLHPRDVRARRQDAGAGRQRRDRRRGRAHRGGVRDARRARRRPGIADAVPGARRWPRRCRPPTSCRCTAR